ncbi:MAG: PfkB family carbohydrate kinase [Hyphomicrobiales bacterium]
MTRQFCIFGGAIIDRVGTIEAPLQIGQSHPGYWKQSVGGVGANVARHLARFGGNVQIATLVGDDEDALSIIQQLKAENLTILPGGTINDCQTPSYTVVHDQVGDVIVGLADMKLHTHMDTNWALGAAKFANPADIWVADTNLPAKSLSTLCDQKGETPIFVVAVSPAKISVLESLGDRIEGLICNKAEADALVGKKSHNAADAAKNLTSLGMPLAIVSNGAAPCAIARNTSNYADVEVIEHNTLKGFVDATRMHLTGVGDTFAAACIFAMSNYARDDVSTLLHANAAASIAMTKPETCPKICWQMVEKRASESKN